MIDTALVELTLDSQELVYLSTDILLSFAHYCGLARTGIAN